MTATTDVLIPALREVREAEAAVADRFRAHLEITPAGEYRESLERRGDDARGHVRRIDEHLHTLQPRGPLPDALGGVRQLAGQAARVARLPLDVAMAAPAAAALRGQGRGAEHQLLKNAEHEYAVTAFAVATCRAGERIAQEADDAVGLELLGTIRRHDEELLEELGSSLEQHAEAMVAAAAPERSSTQQGATDAARAVRAGATRLWETAARWERKAQDAARGAARRVPGAARPQGAPNGEVVAEDELPIADYGQLDAERVTDRLPQLSQADLATVDAYERSHADRSTVLDAIADLLGPVPWPGYDSMTAAEIRMRLRDAEAGLARQVLDYERRHRARSTVLAAAEQAGN